MATEETLEPARQEPQGNPDNATPVQNSNEQPDDGDKQGDADTEVLKKRLADKDSHITKLEEKLRKTPKEAKAPEDDTLWLIDNANDIKLVKEEFAAYKAKGYDRDDALRLAKLDKGITSQSTSELSRQAGTSSAPATVNRTLEGGDDMTLTDSDKAFGIKPETKQKYKGLVEG